MQLRQPSVPLITVDPYFSVWSAADRLTDTVITHWTGAPNTMLGVAEIDGVEYRFMGMYGKDDLPAMTQIKRDADALSTYYTFCEAGIYLDLVFTTPLLLDDYDIMTRPVSFLKATVRSADGKCHSVKVSVSVSEEICMDMRGDYSVTTCAAEGIDHPSYRIGTVDQPVLTRSGDDLRIEWGYFYLTVDSGRAFSDIREVPYHSRPGETKPENFKEEMTFVTAEKELCCCSGNTALFTFAYDDGYSINYFDDFLKSYWNRNGKTIEQAVNEAYDGYDEVMARCKAFSDKLFIDACRAGGEKYAEICEISYRQSVAAHKLVLDKEGNILFISKECFSNGCAATVDVSYPSTPLYLLYNPELVRGMMRPVIRYARSDMNKYDYAPHDCGQYPILKGLYYCGGGMPVEESGNMLIMAAGAAVADGSTDFINENMDLFETWVHYLFEHGDDPEYQLCTDDFAGHLAHNCNLSLKAVMGIAALGIMYKKIGRQDDCDRLMERSRQMAKGWAERASNGDGSYRLVFDRQGTWSMKYNIVWDILFGTNVMDHGVIATEFASYSQHINHYGLPLDCRSTYTKSDWLIWTGTLADRREDFERFVAPLWENYNCSPSRVPCTDWYQTVTSVRVGFQNRTVVGGHFMKLLQVSGKLRNW